MRNGSFMHTQQQMRDGADAARWPNSDGYSRVGKDVTRRLAWGWAEPGMFMCAVSRCQGFKPGEVAEAFGVIRFALVTRERLSAITQAEVVREGFPSMTRNEFVDMFCKHMGAEPSTVLTRIEFLHVDVRRVISARERLTERQIRSLGLGA